jgi:signal transduction histidine kinase
LPTVSGNPTHLFQLFQNLVANAVKFRGKADPVVRISAQADGNCWQFAVADNGIGIERKDFDRIFQVFQRLHGKEYPGTGIGLALCKKIVERHGGRIWVESAPGSGTTFLFTLPAENGVSG